MTKYMLFFYYITLLCMCVPTNLQTTTIVMIKRLNTTNLQSFLFINWRHYTQINYDLIIVVTSMV